MMLLTTAPQAASTDPENRNVRMLPPFRVVSPLSAELPWTCPISHKSVPAPANDPAMTFLWGYNSGWALKTSVATKQNIAIIASTRTSRVQIFMRRNTSPEWRLPTYIIDGNEALL